MSKRPSDMSEFEKHWLLRKTTIRKLWFAGAAILALTVAAEFRIHMHGEFGLDELFGFNAWYGLGTCGLMIAGAKILGLVLKRPDNYYDD